ncbi:ABC-type branched-chain amino acid transport system, substrate-binding protein [Soonwooa buanensis]|uniref:ABC-type branched-chain amino acid transport system, substrate-binding protein n=1 Tax=Soonwooa buanensis TaxID=619805 RepID=A0A1T5EC32_9FLAO|nr:LysM peptidoglycan-binding domain-containing protein [Soonwooa buanensis]SKB81552.1 ABC-type branched-chain amino acid transport system, substrate-binding protein [Soonwooa buanensis]
MIKKFFVLSALATVLTASAQATHKVEPKETPYGIAKKYGLTVAELYQLNPQVKDGALGIGDVLKVSKSGKVVTTTTTPKVTTTTSTAKTGAIILQPKQTIYGITKQYHISEADLRKLNPDLDSHMKIGDQVILPLESIKKYAESTEVVASTTTTTTTTTQPTKIATVESKNLYTVKEKDNYYKISREFNITQKQLFALNPGLEDKGLKVGEQILIAGDAVTTTTEIEDVKPTKTTTTTSTSNNNNTTVNSTNYSTSNSDDFITYTVKSGDTVFGITNRFNVDLSELLALNPDLINGLRAGMVLKIKKLDPMYSKKNGDALNVVMMLPFGFDANDSKYRSMALDFMTGAKLAIERNVASGMNLDIKVIDAGNENTFKNSVSQINQDNTDLIIGPFFKTSVLEVLEFVKNKKIPVVAPFANSEDLYDYSNLIIAETNQDAYIEKIVKEVGQVYSDQKIYIVADDSKANANALKVGLEKSLKKPEVIIVNSANDIKADQNMMTGQSAPVIAVLANDDDNVGTAFANRLIALSKEVTGNKAFSMFYNSIFEKKMDDLSQSSLVYLMDKKINTEGSFEKEVLKDYKTKYCKTPSRYAVVGFDVVNDMLSRENKKGEIFKQINKSQTQLATKFEFTRAKPNGAYINTGYRVVRLVP